MIYRKKFYRDNQIPDDIFFDLNIKNGEFIFDVIRNEY